MIVEAPQSNPKKENAMNKLMAISLLLAVGCITPKGTARFVSVDDKGGIIRLSGDKDGASKRAEDLMDTYCSGSYSVLREDLVVLGLAGGWEGTKPIYTLQQTFICLKKG